MNWQSAAFLMGLLVVFTSAGCNRHALPESVDFKHVERGSQAVDFEILPTQLDQLRVFVFVRTDCPIANRYAPEIKSLQVEFSDIAEFVLVYPAERETMEQIEEHAADYYSNELPVLRDPKHELVAKTAATVTPEVFVYARDQRLLYRGRIDNRYVDFGVTRAEATERELHKVLSAARGALARNENPPSFPATTAVGCFITNYEPTEESAKP